MLLYYVAAPDADLATLATAGVTAPPGERVTLWTTLDAVPSDAGSSEAASEAAPEAEARRLVVDASALDGPPHRATDTRVEVDRVPPSALCNAEPYRPPAEVRAGGGYVVCPLADGDVALLLIHRRGVWDLPKGKRDPGETMETCAAREVREEVGIDALRVVRPLGTTQHGYADDATYAIKTTYWYLMRTPERSFVPEAREGIRRVAWARWDVARRHLGYDTLQTHMDRVADTVVGAIHDDERTA